MLEEMANNEFEPRNDKVKVTVCKYNQQGFCKYRQQCSKQHINRICPSHPLCQHRACEMRHPKQCRTFSQYSKCHFTNCAYLHSTDPNTKKLDRLEQELSDLKETVFNLSSRCEELKLQLQKVNFDDVKQHENEDIEHLKETVKKLLKQSKAKNEKHMCKKSEVRKKTKCKKVKIVKMYECKQCDYKCEKEITLKKHRNTKHINHHDISNIYPEKVIQHNIDNHISECSICDDKFLTEEEYTNHIQEHLQEIKEIDVEYLKSGHEIFDCNTCHFKSNIPEAIKSHLTAHVLKPKDKLKLKSKCKKYKEAMYKSKNWQDMYDEVGNPIFDSTDSDTSSDNEE